MTRQNPERPPGPSYYRLPETAWTMIRDEYLSGRSAKAIAQKWRVSMTSVYRHATDGGWRKSDQSRALHDQVAAGGVDLAGPPGETWTSLKDPPPPSMRRWPQPLPGMGPMRRPAWEPPPGYGPMPPHLVPPVQRPATEPPAPAFEDEADAPSAAEAAEQAVAAAARAVAAGRYEEAERLGRLAATLQKLAGTAPGAKARGPAAFHSVEDDEEAVDQDQLPLDQRAFACTGATCRLDQEREQAYAAVFKLFGQRLKMDDCQDVLAWADMMTGFGAAIEDEDVRRLAATLKAHGPGEAHAQIDEVLGRPSRPGYVYNPMPCAPA